jgi:hypothetical protein
MAVVARNANGPRDLLGPLVSDLDFSSGGRTRTADPVVNSHLLYRLSYAGTWCKSGQ